MNKDRQTETTHQPIQRRDGKQQCVATSPTKNRRPSARDIITYQDSQGHIITEEEEGDYDDSWPPRLPSSARRYQGGGDIQTEDQSRVGQPAIGLPVVPPRQSAVPPLPPGVVLIRGIPCAKVGGTWMKVQWHDSPPPGAGTALHPTHTAALRRREPPRVHWLLFVGIAFCLMVVGWVLLNVGAGWLQGKYDDLLYGRPRTYQTDAIVGHQDSPATPSHFQCLNLDKRIQVIEFPGGNSSQSKVYEGPTLIGPGQELTPCTLSFRDVNGDGKPDMILSIGGILFVMLNDGTSFRPVKPGEHVNL